MGLDPLITTLRAKIRRVDGEILAAVRQQSANGGCSRWLNCAFLRADLLAVTAQGGCTVLSSGRTSWL